MTTLRMRGLYAAALTSLFRQHGETWDIVQPEEAVRASLNHTWRMDSPDVDIDDLPDERGRRYAIRIVGASDKVQQVLEVLRPHCLDILTHCSSTQVGATYMGYVGLVSHARRRAVVYLGNQLVGLLPLRYEDRDVRLDAYIPVRVEAPTTGEDERPQLSTTLTIPGDYAVLSSAPTVRVSKQIADDEARERLQRLGETLTTEGWGIIWRTAAQEAAPRALEEEIRRLSQEAQRLRERIAMATTVGYLQGGEMSAQVFMLGHTQAVCDSWRAALIPTLPGHHTYKAQGDLYGAAVDALEKELPPDLLRARTAPLSVLSSIDAMQLPIHDLVRLYSRGFDGRLTDQGDGQREAYDIDAGWVDVRQAIRHKESYPPGLRIDRQPGDYTLTRFQEGSWQYITHFYGRSGAWKGTLAAVTLPIAIFADQLHCGHLATVTYSPEQSPALTGLEALHSWQHQGVISTACVQKIQAESTALLQHCTAQHAAIAVQGEPS